MDHIISLLFKSFYIFLPAYIATSLPLVAAGFRLLESLNKPIDMGAKIQGVRIFGDHKTIRGFIIGICGGVLISFGQYVFARMGFEIKNEVLDYTKISQVLSYGVLMSSGALIGDAIESFIKRKLDIHPGESLIIADQIDYIIGAVLLTFPFFKIPAEIIMPYFFLAFALHLLSGFFSTIVGMKRKWI